VRVGLDRAPRCRLRAALGGGPARRDNGPLAGGKVPGLACWGSRRPPRAEQFRKVMTNAATHPEAEVERLLRSLAGIVSAKVVSDSLGRVGEIHVLASDRLHPKQVVRNVESALSAGLGIVIDRRVVSVAQVRMDEYRAHLEAGAAASAASRADPAGWPQPSPGSPPPLAASLPVRDAPESDPVPLPPLAEERYVFVGYDVRNQTNRETVCHVTIARGREHYTGSGTGASTALGRAQAAARALFAALRTVRETEDLLMETASLVDAHGRTYVLVSAQAVTGRQTEPLTGVAVLQRSPEEGAVLAGLQAVNRWASTRD